MDPSAPMTGATALRPRWRDLPHRIQRVIETNTGSTVVKARSQDRGFTSGFASRLSFADGQRLFVKAADNATRAPFADAYRREAHVLPALPSQVLAPRVQWSYDAEGWIVLALDDIEGLHPRRPWRDAELRVVLGAIARTACLLDPAPDAITAPPFGAELGDLAGYWESLTHLPDSGPAAELARHGVRAAAGNGLVHTDVRDDNLLIDGRGSVWLVDWNFVCRGAGWFDSVGLLISAHGDGLDADGIVATHELTRDVEADDLDGVLALLAGYFLEMSRREVPETSPQLRHHQRWYADAAWDWLRRRRGWTT